MRTYAEDVPLVEFMYRMPGESYRRRLRSLLLCLCWVFRALINSLVCWLWSTHSCILGVSLQRQTATVLRKANNLIVVNRRCTPRPQSRNARIPRQMLLIVARREALIFDAPLQPRLQFQECHLIPFLIYPLVFVCLVLLLFSILSFFC